MKEGRGSLLHEIACPLPYTKNNHFNASMGSKQDKHLVLIKSNSPLFSVEEKRAVKEGAGELGHPE